MVTEQGRVKVLDFGLAKDLRGTAPDDVTLSSLSHTKAGVVLGTIAYMSPEQIAGGAVDHRTDIFSLGVVLFEMCSGRPPFVGSSSAERISSILRDTPPSVSEMRTDLPEDLARIVRRCLEKDLRYRMQTARDVANEFRELRQQAAIGSSGAPSGGHRAAEAQMKSSAESLAAKGAWTQKAGRVKPLVMAAVVALAALGAGLWYLGRPRPAPRVTGFTQITQDHLTKILVGTDGNRLYFMQYSPRSFRQVAVNGGESAPIPYTPKGDAPFVYGLSPDGSSLLYGSAEEGNPVDTLYVVPVLGGPSRRLALARDAAFSPDGSSVAYMTYEGELWTIRPDGSGARRLVPVGGKNNNYVFALAWSPDGCSIIFQRDSLLWEVSTDGSSLHQVLPGWGLQGVQRTGRWSPDGRTFYFVWGRTAKEEQIWVVDMHRGLLHPEHSEPVPLTTGPIVWSLPIPSKDGKRVFAVGLTQRGELDRIDPRTGSSSVLLGGISAEDVAFSRDGKSVAYVLFPEGTLWKADRDGTNPVQLTEPPIFVIGPRWSPDGTRILYQGNSENSPNSAYVVSADGGGPRRILPDDKETESDPNWSPDGRRIVFTSAGIQNGNLKILDVASGQVSTIPDSTGQWSPRWSPDGRYLASPKWGAHVLRIYDLSTQQWSAHQVNREINYPCWSKDSQSLYFLTDNKDDQGIYRIGLHGTGADRIADLKDWHNAGHYGFWFGLDPNDAPLLLRDVGSEDIYALNLDVK
jgi:Tol biopolymer transport system component